MTELLVHGVPTSSSLAVIVIAVTTFNSGLALTTQPRCLPTEACRIGNSVHFGAGRGGFSRLRPRGNTGLGGMF